MQSVLFYLDKSSFMTEDTEVHFYISRRDSTAFVPMELLLKFMGWPRGIKIF